MAFVLVHVTFSVFLLFFGRLRHTTSTSAPGNCSWYTFHTNKECWLSNSQYCQKNGGNLVSMETEEEYYFINKTIQSRNVTNNEWHIGLKRKNGGEWKWISNHSLTIDKWQPNEPSKDGDCVVMAKNYPTGHYGLFNDLRCNIHKMFICEYKTEEAKRFKNATTSCIKNNNNEKNSYVLSINTTSNPRTTSHRRKEGNTASGFWKHTNTSTIIDDSTVSTTSNSITKTSSQPSNMLVVIAVLAILLGVFICIFIIVFCWLRNKSRKWKTEKPESRKPSKTNTVTDAAGHGQDIINNVNSEGVEITDAYSVLYVVPNDDIDYPKAPTHIKKRDKQEVVDICYAEVHDALPPSCNKPTTCDEENEYLAPVDIAPTSDTRLHSAAVVTSTNDNDYKRLPHGTTGPSSNSNLYATTDLNSYLHQVDSNIISITSKNDKGQCLAHWSTGQRSCSSLYATTDLNSEQNNCFERDSIVRKAEKENQASKRVKRNSCQPNVGAIMSSSQKSQGATRAPSLCKGKTEDKTMYAMVDLLDNNTELHRIEDNVLYAKVEKSRKN